MFFRSTALTATAAALLMLAGAPAHAESPVMDGTQAQAQQQQMPQTAEAPSFSEATLNAYAESAMKVGAIHQQMAPQIQAAESEEVQQQLFVDMREKMVNQIETTEGITVAEYQQISQAASQNSELASVIREKLRTMMQ